MIEVEKKFLLNESDKERLIDGATFLNERTFTDVYYDDTAYTLTSRDKWLRSRDGQFELKLPMHTETERLVDQYEELNAEADIRQALHLRVEETFLEDLKNNGYSPFCICKTTRKKYQKGVFTIDLDVVEFKEFTYTIGEIELTVEEKREIEKAVEEIVFFAEQHSLTVAPVRGKVIEYIKRIRPEQYRTLITSGVVQEKMEK